MVNGWYTPQRAPHGVPSNGPRVPPAVSTERGPVFVPHLEEQELSWTNLDQRAVDTIRVLAADAVEKVGNGHPGTAMSLAPAAYTIFQKVMRHDPADPEWTGRDRFVLSPGHTSLTLYTQLFLAGYELELDDLKAFRTHGSKTPGHPEYGHTAGVETTTGPLGQGVANAVGMAMAARYERGLFDPEAPEGESPFDHTIWGNRLRRRPRGGHLRRGILAGRPPKARQPGLPLRRQPHLHRGRHRDGVLRGRAEAVRGVRLARAADRARRRRRPRRARPVRGPQVCAQAETGRPSIIAMRTIIAWPAPNARNTEAAHGSALGEDEVAATKRLLGFDPSRSFEVADEVLAHSRRALDRGAEAHAAWDKRIDKWRGAQPERAKLFDRIVAGQLPEGWEDALPVFEEGKSVATRAASGKVLQSLGAVLPELWGGSADLAGSNNTTIDKTSSFLPKGNPLPEADPYGRTIHFGIREHSMAAEMNGIALHGNTRIYGGTFLVFSDYMRNAVRLSALMQLPVTYVWTHDSIGLGEDGPTHQPVEHLASLRAIPGLNVVRPADANEVAVAWKTMLENHSNPAGIVLTRQNIPTWERGEGAADGDTFGSVAGVAKGGYVLAEASKDGATVPADVILIGTGSEVQLAVQAREALQAEGIAARVVSMPCVEWFNKQDAAYRESVLPAAVKARVSVEAGLALGWKEFVGDAGRSVSLEHYGASADYKRLFQEFGITAEAVAAAAKDSLAGLQA
jgi:transketolase